MWPYPQTVRGQRALGIRRGWLRRGWPQSCSTTRPPAQEGGPCCGESEPGRRAPGFQGVSLRVPGPQGHRAAESQALKAQHTAPHPTVISCPLLASVSSLSCGVTSSSRSKAFEEATTQILDSTEPGEHGPGQHRARTARSLDPGGAQLQGSSLPLGPPSTAWP